MVLGLCVRTMRLFRFLFGTNDPMRTPTARYDGLDTLGLSPATQRLILGDNARRVFRLDDLLPPVA